MITQIQGNQSTKRVFQYIRSDRANLFEGLPYVQFDAFVRRDKIMQLVVVRDLLKIIADKCNTLKNMLLDKGRMKRILALMQLPQVSTFNMRVEETISLMGVVGWEILQDYKDTPDSIGLKSYPFDIEVIDPSKMPAQVVEKKSMFITQNQAPPYVKRGRPVPIEQEDKLFEQNVDLFCDMLQQFRDRVEVYMIMVRQPNYKIMNDEFCHSFLKDVTALRYHLLSLSEDFRILDQNTEDRIRLVKLSLPQQKSEEILRKTQITSLRSNKNIYDQEEATKQRQLQERRNELMAQKFNYSKKNFLTRESKVVLSQDKLEQEKLLILESSLKSSKIKHVYADNRKRLAIEKLKDPTKDPSLKEALEIMSKVLNINVADLFS